LNMKFVWVCAKEARREGRRSFYLVGKRRRPTIHICFFFFDASSRKKITIHLENESSKFITK
jgi:hypothetical protein